MTTAARLPSWAELARMHAVRLRSELLRYRDGARLAAGAVRRDQSVQRIRLAALPMFGSVEIAPGPAIRCLETLGDYTAGFVIAEQASPAAAMADDAAFERGIGLILAGFAAELPTGRRAWLDYRDYRTDHPISDNIP